MRALFAVSLLTLICVAPALCQDDEASVTGPGLLEHTRVQEAIRAATPNIRVDVNMALVPVTVVDSYGRNVTGLDRENFRVIDNGHQIPIVSFAQQDQPITVGLVFDCSRSMTDKFLTARAAPRQLFDQLDDQDEAFLITVSDTPVLRQSFTSNFNEILSSLLFVHPQGTTSLIDGVYMGLQEMKHAHNPRKALIVVSDGGDNDSRYTLRELERYAAEADTEIFAIGIFKNPETEEEVNGPALLADLAGRTGGVNYVVRKLDDVRDVMARIGINLHNQYVLGLHPPANAPGGKYRRIKVQLLVPAGLPPLTLFARSGYYVPER